MGNATFISVIAPNYNVTSDGARVGFGHAGLIVVNPNGSADYYEYGLYKQDSFTITNNSNGNIRTLSLQSMEFDASGNVTNAAIKGALDQVFGSSGMYHSDTGMIVGAPVGISNDQFNNVQNFIDSKTKAINNQQDSYSILNNNDCLDFVYGAAGAAGQTISSTQGILGPSVPLDAARGVLEQAGGGYQYFSPNSWNTNSISLGK